MVYNIIRLLLPFCSSHQIMQPLDIPTPTPQKSKLSFEEHKEHPKSMTVPRYSDKYKQFIAKATTVRKLAPEYQTPPKQVQRHLDEKPSYFFFRVKSIGVGAHSFVFLIQEEHSKLLLAEKSVTKQHSKAIEKDLIEQIKLLFHLDHPNIIKLYHVYSSQTHINLVMEFAEDSLFALKQKVGVFKQKQVIEVIRQLLVALAYLHSKRVVHADVKLENIMISSGIIKLCDFGLAHRKGKNREEEIKQSKQKQVVGTLEYLPPEYAQGIDSGEARDVWAVGILAFEMATGRHPFQGLKENEKWAKLINYPPSIYLRQLQEAQLHAQAPFNKVKELVRGIFVPWEKRWSAQKLLQLPCFNQAEH